MSGRGVEARIPLTGRIGAGALGVRTESSLRLLTRLNGRGFRLVQLADMLVLLAIMMSTNLARFGLAWPTYPHSAYVVAFMVAAAVHLLVYYFGGLYEREPRLGYSPVLPRVARLTMVAVLIVATLAYVTSGSGMRLLPAPSLNLAILLVLGTVGVTGNRRLAQRLRVRREGPPRVLLVGSPDEVDIAGQHLRDEASRADVVAAVSSTDELLDCVDRFAATEVVLVSSRWLETLYPALLLQLGQRGVSVLHRVTAKETLFGLERMCQIGGMPFVRLRSQALPRSRARFKRAVELGALVVAAPVLLSALAVLALYHLAVVGHPILFWQERVGCGGRVFRMVKFRTMRLGAEEDGNPRLATRDDPRIVSGCRWLRAMRLDELPQVWNVLRGEMSLVGPRPERPAITERCEELIPGYARRYQLPPGITGLAQVNGRYDTDPEYKLGYDLHYLVNWSPLLDLEILARTVWVVLTRRV